MDSDILLSLCIPTNGVIEWVVPVLDSIYEEKNPVGCFEVIVTDNGCNEEFEEIMQNYALRYENLVYKKTDAFQFLNQIEAFKMARGRLIKFINHRMKLLPGALNEFLLFAGNNMKDKPGVYFLNGSLPLPDGDNLYTCFNDYVKALSYFSSWSGGTTIWKEDFEKMDLGISFNSLFPHTDIVFSDKNKRKYVINNQKLLEDIPADVTKKGNYDLFYAFAVEYVRILKKLYESENITEDTYEYVKRKNREFVATLYFDYVFCKKPCSYDLSGYKKSVAVFYSDSQIKREVLLRIFRTIIRKTRRILHI